VDLGRDVLDKQLLDRHGRLMGKADGIVLELRDGAPPRVVAIAQGAFTVGRRVGPRFARWLRALAQASGVTDGEPRRYAFTAVMDVGRNVKLDVDAEECGAWAWERWLRQHVVARIPGSGVGKQE
jgi:hypothetical protein